VLIVPESVQKPLPIVSGLLIQLTILDNEEQRGKHPRTVETCLAKGLGPIRERRGCAWGRKLLGSKRSDPRVAGVRLPPEGVRVRDYLQRLLG
jgi:hypothetical protein